MNRCIVMSSGLKKALLTHLSRNQRWLSVVATVSLFPLFVPVAPASAFPSFVQIRRQDYRNCTQQLTNAGLSVELATQGCSMAARPKNMGYCVTQMQKNVAALPVEQILSGCLQVRRPDELANCVVNISSNTNSSDPLNILDSCRRSVLPEKLSFCVVGLIEANTNLGVDQVLKTCLTPPENVVELQQDNSIELKLDTPSQQPQQQ
ncbi:hypothetical protein [Planktothrix mougeotii]|uniref:Uncharacterized protein n=1 Tax=Planktothrix mougeotii LEGE 06226 TaxID=1828728 RepID=A0ABR9UJ96_9CYAN|nr:hypothetical protein [Planktothrix mougeotii]MBE9145891.1 hypothetical protein [Planktothrix mougeotii LEGE 06226]